MKNYKLYIVLLVLIILFFQQFQIKKLKVENVRFSQNQEALLKESEYYQNEYGQSQASVERLSLNNSEMKDYKSQLVKEIENMKIKLKRVRSISTANIETNMIYETLIRDSIRVWDTIRCMTYANPWTSIQGCIVDSTFFGKVASRDTLLQIVHKVPKKWLFIKWGCKAIRQELISKNPNTSIVFSEYIELTK